MTFEQKAEALASAFTKAEKACADVTEAMKAFVTDPAFSGALTKKTLIREAQGVEGALCRLHLDVTPFDPRPQPFDGGGK